jgi:hypothetical protein
MLDGLVHRKPPFVGFLHIEATAEAGMGSRKMRTAFPREGKAALSVMPLGP